MAWYYWIILIVIVFIVWGYYSNKVKREKLMEKYKDPILVDKLMKGNFWVGQTKEELIDALGNPKDISEKILKTKKKEIYKYDKTGNNRYALKITLENDIVVGWDKK
jgi:uncharacterized membrane protein